MTVPGVLCLGQNAFADTHTVSAPDADTAAGLIYGGAGKMFPNSMTLAQTWKQNLAREWHHDRNEALLGGCNSWQASSRSVHRTPPSGHNGKYYSGGGRFHGDGR